MYEICREKKKGYTTRGIRKIKVNFQNITGKDNKGAQFWEYNIIGRVQYNWNDRDLGRKKH